MNANKIDNLNIFLILASLILAVKLPFQLFVFSYVVLGPLHYLTEINWISNKAFFLKKPKWSAVLLVLSLLIALPLLHNLPAFNKVLGANFLNEAVQKISNYSNNFILIALLFSIGIIHFENWKNIFLFFIFSVAFSYLILKYIQFSTIIVGVFIPTIIHVYIFTLLFMILGAINSKNIGSIIALIFLIISPLLIFNLPINLLDYTQAKENTGKFAEVNFSNLAKAIATFLGDKTNHYVLFSEMGIKIQIFIAFCYTYHYLNWFSKTTVIGWYKIINPTKLFFIFSFWLISVLFYWYNSKAGLLLLFFLSFLHVILEFPLNLLTIKYIAHKLIVKLKQSVYLRLNNKIL